MKLFATVYTAVLSALLTAIAFYILLAKPLMLFAFTRWS